MKNKNKIKAALITAGIMTIPGGIILVGIHHTEVVIVTGLIVVSAMLIYGVYKAIESEFNDML